DACSFDTCQPHLFDKRGINRHVLVACQVNEALREVGIVGRKRGIDLALGHGGIEGGCDRVVGKRNRIVRRGEQRLRFIGARGDGKRSNAQGYGKAEWHRDPHSGHPAPSTLAQASNDATVEACLIWYGGLEHRVQDPKKLTLSGDRPFTLEIGYPGRYGVVMVSCAT